MSVLMTLRVAGDEKSIEATDPAVLQTIIDRAQSMGCTRHRFYGNGTEVLVVDEWPDEETFQKFFEASPEIKDLMDNAGVTTPPEITFWRHLDVKDDIG
jgi:hypothetical protein